MDADRVGIIKTIVGFMILIVSFFIKDPNARRIVALIASTILLFSAVDLKNTSNKALKIYADLAFIIFALATFDFLFALI
ncbi:MAG TPA: hypothetical protein H9783_00840 [Candidatus Limosilactobacillus faecipullorum]|nr:hypothetical protein [Candidatus Limosilactobacillus faecipullorum]